MWTPFWISLVPNSLVGTLASSLHLGIDCSVASMWKCLYSKNSIFFLNTRNFVKPKLLFCRAFCKFDHNDSSSMATGAAEYHDFPKEEDNILKLWDKLDAFQSCMRQSKDKPRFEIYAFISFQDHVFSVEKFWSLKQTYA